jgi:hypothetical protein
MITFTPMRAELKTGTTGQQEPRINGMRKLPKVLSIVFILLSPEVGHSLSNDYRITTAKDGSPVTFDDVKNNWSRWSASPSIWEKLKSLRDVDVTRFFGDLGLGKIRGASVADRLNAIQVLGMRNAIESTDALLAIAKENFRLPDPKDGRMLNATAARWLLDKSQAYDDLALQILDAAASEGVVICPFSHQKKGPSSPSSQEIALLRQWFASSIPDLKLGASICMAEVGVDDDRVFEFANSELKKMDESNRLEGRKKRKLELILLHQRKRKVRTATELLKSRGQ